MKKIAFAVAVLAAMTFGMPSAKAAPPAPIFNWTGFYVGAHAGYGWESGSESGAIGGLQLGYNWQVSPNWVFGVEGDYTWTDIREPVIPARIDYLASVRGRLGYAQDRVLFYGTGGWGTTQVTGAGVSVTGDAWVLGAGIEWLFAPNWSARVEFLHYEFDDNGLAGDAYARVIRFGVNYRFGMTGR